MKKMRSLPLARKPKPEMIVHKTLEQKAQHYVQSKYFGTFFQRHEDGLAATSIVLGSLVIGLPLALLLSASLLETLLLGSFWLTMGMATLYVLFLSAQLTYKELRKMPDAHPGKKILMVFVGITAFSVVMCLVMAFAAFIAVYVSALISGIQTGAFMAKAFAMALAITMPIASLGAISRKYLTKTKLLPPELKKSNFLQRRKLRTSKGAIQRYLLDQIEEMEKGSLEAIDELLIKARLASQRAGVFVARFRASVVQEKGEAPGYLKDSYEHAQAVDRDCKAAVAKLENHRNAVVAFYTACRDQANGLTKIAKDQKLISEFLGFQKEAKQLPRKVDQIVADTSEEILKNSKELDEAHKKLRDEAEIDHTIESLEDASLESIEKLEAVIEKCLNIKVPKDND